MRTLAVIVVVNFIFSPNSEASNTAKRRQYSDQLYFPPTSYQFDLEQLFRIQRAINARNKVQSITPKTLPKTLPKIPLIFFDEDDNEPLAPEPVFQLRIETPTKKPISVIPTISPIPRWPPMMSTSTITPKVVTPPVSKVTFFPSNKTPKPLPRPEDKVKILATSPKPQASKIKPVKATISTTPRSSPPQKTQIISSPEPEAIQDENGVDNDEIILLEGSFYAPFLKPRNK